MLFNKSLPWANIVGLAAEKAQEVYNFLALGHSLSEARVLANITMPKAKEVEVEYKRLESEVLSYMSRDSSPETKEDLIFLISSDLLDVEILVNDVIKYYPFYDPDTPWEDFYAYFNPPPPEEPPEE